MTTTDNVAIALALAQHLMTAAANTMALINQARLEGRAITNEELGKLASEDDLARAELQAEIDKDRIAHEQAAGSPGVGG